MPGRAQSALTDEVTHFETELRRLALAIVAEVFAAELASRRRELEARAPRRGRAATPTRTRRRAAAVTGEPAAPVAPAGEPALADAPRKGRKPSWSREDVIGELATWLLSGAVPDAAFLTRHGKPGLVAASKRLFGRFDAALNAANLHLAQQYPDGLPTRAHRAPPAS